MNKIKKYSKNFN